MVILTNKQAQSIMPLLNEATATIKELQRRNSYLQAEIHHLKNLLDNQNKSYINKIRTEGTLYLTEGVFAKLKKDIENS